MSEKSNLNRNSQVKQEKLIDFANQLIWLMITKSILIKKDIQNLISDSYPKYQNPSLWIKKIKKYQIVIRIAQCIITKIVNNQIAFYIIDLKNFQDIWDKLKSIYTKIGQGVIYLIF